MAGTRRRRQIASPKRRESRRAGRRDAAFARAVDALEAAAKDWIREEEEETE